jgi:hypothetical protein
VILGPPEPAARRRRWPIVAAFAVAGVLVAVAIAIAVATRSDEPSRQQIVAARGAAVMPFDLDATTHVFDATDTGGVQTLVADDPTDAEQIALIRTHLRHEVERFRVGDFGDPASIHGHDMPGIGTLDANADALDVSYRDIADGAEVTYVSAEPTVIAALHDWFAAQRSDHGDHARAG